MLERQPEKTLISETNLYFLKYVKRFCLVLYNFVIICLYLFFLALQISGLKNSALQTSDQIWQWRDPNPNQSHGRPIEAQRQLPDGQVEKIGTRDLYQNQSHRMPIIDQRQLPDGSVELQRANNKKPFPMEKIRKFEGNIKIEPMGPFPDLIIMNLYKGKVYTGLRLLQKCFAESPYGPLRVETIDQGFYV